MKKPAALWAAGFKFFILQLAKRPVWGLEGVHQAQTVALNLCNKRWSCCGC
jgi:hypothetical protein